MYKQTLYKILENVIPQKVLKSYNKSKKWKYGYNKEFDIVVISKDGTIDEVYEIQNLKIALPQKKDVYNFEGNYWGKLEYPKELSKIKNVFDWEKYPDTFKEKWYDYIDKEFERREEGFGLITKTFLLILLALITCTCAGPKLILGSQTLESPIDYSIYFGRHAKRTFVHTECAILKTGVQAFRLCPHQNSCIQQPPHVTHVLAYCQKQGRMLRRCSPIKSYPYPSTIHSSSNQSKTEWTGRRRSLRIESQHPNLPERNLIKIKPLRNSKVSIPPLTGKTQGTTHTMGKN